MRRRVDGAILLGFAIRPVLCTDLNATGECGQECLRRA